MIRVYGTPSSFGISLAAPTVAVTFAIPAGAQSAVWGAQGVWTLRQKLTAHFDWRTAGGTAQWGGGETSGSYTSSAPALPGQITDINNAVGGNLVVTCGMVLVANNIEDAVSSVWLDLIGCDYSITPVTATFGPEGGSGSEALTTQSPCPWTPVSDAGWLTVTSPVGRQIGNGTVNYSVAVNTGPQRTAHITCGSAVFTVTQGRCTYLLDRAGESFGVAGGPGNFGILTQSPCPWTAVSNNPSWLHVSPGPASGTGTWQVALTIDPQSSSCAPPRVGTVTAGGQTYTATQAGQGSAVVTLQTQKWSPENADATEVYLLTYPCGYYRADLNGQFGTPGASFDTAAYAGAGSAAVVSGVVVVYDSTGVELTAGAACSSVNVWRYIYA